MVELQLKAQRGIFQLEIECSLKAPWTVVFGPSGAGKSTLLRLIAGLDHPDTGRVAIHGQCVTDTAIGLNLRPGPYPGQRSVGLVAQHSALFPHLSITSNAGYGVSRQDRREHPTLIEEMLDLVGASHLIHRRPRQLSGGEAQRISLARALAPMPRLLLLDEPLSALDADARDQVLTRLQAWLSAQKIQTILVTHDAADALATEAEVALLHEGKLTALGPASVVLAAERNRLLARLQST